jgi:hypothetical protein
VVLLQVTINKNGLPAAITAATGASFTLTTMYMTSVSSDQLQVIIEGYKSGSVAASETVTLSTSGPQLVTLPAAFAGVESVLFTPDIGATTPSVAISQFAIDNLSLQYTPPPLGGGSIPTAAPTAPTAAPSTEAPTAAPTTAAPTASPTASPTAAPTTAAPTASPTAAPTSVPTSAAASPPPAMSSPPPAAPPAPVASQTCSSETIVTFDTGLVDGTLSQVVNTLGGVAGAEGLTFPGFVPADGYDEVSRHVLPDDYQGVSVAHVSSS